MSFKRSLLAAAALLLMMPAAQAANYYGEPTTTVGRAEAPRTTSETAGETPSLISVGMGWWDFSPNSPQKSALDIRGEYRWGYTINPWWQSYVQLHPYAGIEVSPLGQFYGFGGLLLDIPLSKHWVVTPQTAVGLYAMGNGKRLGSIVEFRSGLELAYRFENQQRVSAYISHESNAHLTHKNPGANTIGMYWHIPVTTIFGE